MATNLAEVSSSLGRRVLGLLILALWLANPGGTEPGVDAAPTRSPEEVAELSEQKRATQVAANKAAADELTSSGASVVDLPHHRLTAIRVDPPITLEQAVAADSSLITGVVVNQFIEAGPHPLVGTPTTFLISLLQTADGTTRRVAQVAGVFVVSGETVLTFNSGTDPLLERGSAYALLVQKIEQPDAYLIVRGHTYALGSDNTLKPLLPFSGNAALSGQDLGVLETLIEAQ